MASRRLPDLTDQVRKLVQPPQPTTLAGAAGCDYLAWATSVFTVVELARGHHHATAEILRTLIREAVRE